MTTVDTEPVARPMVTAICVIANAIAQIYPPTQPNVGHTHGLRFTYKFDTDGKGVVGGGACMAEEYDG